MRFPHVSLISPPLHSLGRFRSLSPRFLPPVSLLRPFTCLSVCPSQISCDVNDIIFVVRKGFSVIPIALQAEIKEARGKPKNRASICMSDSKLQGTTEEGERSREKRDRREEMEEREDGRKHATKPTRMHILKRSQLLSLHNSIVREVDSDQLQTLFDAYGI